jgi:hypothetical protein
MSIDLDQFHNFGRTLLRDYSILHSVSIGYPDSEAREKEEPCLILSYCPPLPGADGARDLPPKSVAEKYGLRVVFENRMTARPQAGVVAAEGIRPTRLQETLRPGLSIGPAPDMSERHVRHGTLGCIVFENGTGDPLILTNWHVLSGPGDLLLQPCSLHVSKHGPDSKDVCGCLRAACVDLDCAVADIDESRHYNREMLGLGVTPEKAEDADLGDRVVKFGNGNNRSYGIVTRIGVVRMNYGGDYSDVFLPCFEIERDPKVTQRDPHARRERELVRPGDSGCVWMLRYRANDPKAANEREVEENLTEDPTCAAPPPSKDPQLQATSTALGLHFGEDDSTKERGLAVPMTKVLDRLQVSLTPH